MTVAPSHCKYISEFVGTFILVLTVTLNVLGNTGPWAAVSIASSLMVSVYAFGNCSGAHLNPAVTIAAVLAQKQKDYVEAVIYIVVQCAAGIAAGFTGFYVHGHAFTLEPAKGYSWKEVTVVEMLYTSFLCFVVLNVATTTATKGNQYYGLAIGWVIIAAAGACGGISGAALNPAVALGIDVPSYKMGFGYCGVYIAAQVGGAILAALMHRLVHPEEYQPKTELWATISKLSAEFIGTFFLVFTVGLNVMLGTPGAAFSIAAALMCGIYACAAASGAHLNPAVTVAILASGRNKITPVEAVQYILVQLAGGIIGGLSYVGVSGRAFPLAPGAGVTWGSAGMAEFLFTFVLAFTVLNVATTQSPSRDMFGLAIASCVTIGGFAAGAVSGGSLNPAVSVGVDLANVLKGGKFMNSLAYTAFEVMGGVMAAAAFMLVHPSEYNQKRR